MAISNKKRQAPVTAEDVLALVDDYQIFRRFLGEFPINRKFCNPFRQEKNPSCIIRDYEGRLIMSDYGDSRWNGDCFNMVKCAFNCDYNTALKTVDIHFGLGLFDGKQSEAKVLYKKPEIKKAYRSKIFTRITENNPDGDRYLAQYGLSLEDMNFCSDTTVSYLTELVIDYRKEYIGKLGMEYELKNERGIWKKIHRPYADKANKWRSNIPFREMHGVGNISNCEIGVVTKSLKDGAFINKYLIPNIEIVQAENYDALTDENKRRLKQSCKRLIISFDNDATGVEECIKLTKELECEYINPPKNLIEKGATDWTDMCLLYKSPEPVINFWKEKQIL